jgi:hypothetical protein
MKWKAVSRIVIRSLAFSFEELSGCKVIFEKCADAELVRTREQQMWDNYVGKLTYIDNLPKAKSSFDRYSFSRLVDDHRSVADVAVETPPGLENVVSTCTIGAKSGSGRFFAQH